MDLNSVLLIIIMRAMIRLKSIEILVKSNRSIQLIRTHSFGVGDPLILYKQANYTADVKTLLVAMGYAQNCRQQQL